MIYILAGDIRSGKTSALEEWIGTWDNVKGVLCPDDSDTDLRYLYNIETAERFPLEVSKAGDNTTRVGKYHFLSDSFKMASFLLIKTFEEQDFEFLVLDELGKLELKGEGIHQAANYIIGNYESSDDKNLLLVVRTNLVKDIIAHYDIKSFQIVAKEMLP
jgi:nucleoside-triphosphatase